MKIVAISDTHLQHWGIEMPPPDSVDVLVHAGDALSSGRKKEWEDFSKWWNGLPYQFKVFVPGNHDIVCQTDTEWARAQLKDTYFLIDEGCSIQGRRFWGSPWQPPFNDWAFNLDDAGRKEKFNLIPGETAILVTHAPPQRSLDRVFSRPELEHLGDEMLRIQTMQQSHLPPVHIFGHIHDSYGVGLRSNMHNQGLVVNASICNEGYKGVNKPLIIHC